MTKKTQPETNFNTVSHPDSLFGRGDGVFKPNIGQICKFCTKDLEF